MALTRSQLLSGNNNNGITLPGQPQGVIAGAGINISNTGIISVDSSSVTGLVKLNDPFAYNSYVWPGADGAAGEFLQTDGAGNLAWNVPTGLSVVTVQPQPAPSPPDIGELWFDCSTGTLNVYQNCVGSPVPNWFNVAQPGKPVDPALTSAVPPFSNQGTPGAGTQANPYDCTVTTVSSGSSTFIVNTVTVSGLAAYQYVPIVDLNAVTNLGRFSFSNYYANASGVLIFQVIFKDLPASGSGAVYNAAIRVGYASAYIDATVNVTLPLTLSGGSIAGTPTSGTPVSFTPPVASGGTGPYTYSYQWRANGVNIGSASSNPAFTPTAAQVGQTLSVVTTVTDSTTASASVTTTASAATVASAISGWTPTGSMTTIPGGLTGAYTGAGTTITATGCIQVSINGGAYGTGGPIVSGQTMAIRWSTSPACGGGPTSSTPITGTLTDGIGTNSYSVAVNRVPTPSISDLTDTNVPLGGTVSEGIATPIAGLTTTAYVTYVGTSTGGTIGASLTPGGPFTPLATSGTGFAINNLQTLYIEQTAGTAVNTSPGYTAIIRVGDGTNTAGTYDEFTYFAQTVSTAVFPNTALSPTTGPNATPAGVNFTDATLGPLDGTMSANGPAFWADGAVTLSANNMLLDINSGGFGSGGLINPGETLAVAWLPSYISTLAHDAIASGDFTDTTYTNSYTYQVKKQPAFLLPGDPGNAAKSAQQTTTPFTPDDYNSPVTVSFTNPTTSGAVPMITGTMQVVVNGGTTTNIVLGTTTITINPGDSLEILGDTGAGVSTTYGMTVTIGSSPAQEWLVTTSAATPYIVTPVIQSPSNNSTGINPALNSPSAITYSADPYDPQDGAPAHNCSDWQVYNSTQDYLPSDEITAVGAVSPIYSNGLQPSNVAYTINNPQNAFDGQFNIAGSSAPNGAGAAGGIIWQSGGPVPSLTIPAGKSLYISSSTNSGLSAKVNGGVVAIADPGVGTNVVKLVDGPVTVTSFEIWRPDNAANLRAVGLMDTTQGAGPISGPAAAASGILDLYIDGKQTLTLSSSKNLATMQAGDTVIQNNSTGPAYSPSLTTTSGFESGYPGTRAFDSNLTTEAIPAGIDSTLTFTLNPAWGLSGTLEIYSGNSVQVSINGGAYGASLGSNQWNQIAADASTVTSFTLKRTGSQPSLSAVRVNGVWLQDYAPSGRVVSTNTSTNQIVLANSSGTWGPANSGKYVLDTNRQNGFNPTSSAITTVGPVVTQPQWYLGLTTDTSFNTPQSNAFDGSDGSYAGASGNGYVRWTPSTPVTYTTSFEYFNQGNADYQINGGAPTTFSGTGWQTIATGSGTITTFQVNRGGGAFFSEVRIDGQKLINGLQTQLLTFTDGTDLAIMDVGDTVKQDNATATECFLIATGTTTPYDLSTSPYRYIAIYQLNGTFDASGTMTLAGNLNVPYYRATPTNFDSLIDFSTLTAQSAPVPSSVAVSGLNQLLFDKTQLSGSLNVTSSTGGYYIYGSNSPVFPAGLTGTIIYNPSGTIAAKNSASSPYTLTLSNPKGTWSTTRTAVDISRYITYASIGPITSTNASTAYAAGVLTIAGCASQGMKVGQTITSMNTPDATGVITAISDTAITLSNVTGTWTPAGGQYITTIVGSPIVNVVCDTGNLESYSVPQALLSTSTKYYARVRYKSGAPVVTSQWSPWNTITTASSFALTPGLAMQGGFFAGQINDGGIIYNLIVAPKATGEYPLTGIRYKNSATGETLAAMLNTVYGKIPQDTALGQGLPTGTYPAFEWADALSLSGYNDWYIPAKNELEVLYYYLKPMTSVAQPNTTGSGSNPNAVSPEPVSTNYTTTAPTQTTAGDFQLGGNEEMDASTYWSATKASPVGSSDAAFQAFSNGNQNVNTMTNLYNARAIRRVQA